MTILLPSGDHQTSTLSPWLRMEVGVLVKIERRQDGCPKVSYPEALQWIQAYSTQPKSNGSAGKSAEQWLAWVGCEGYDQFCWDVREGCTGCELPSRRCREIHPLRMVEDIGEKRIWAGYNGYQWRAGLVPIVAKSATTKPTTAWLLHLYKL